MKDSTLLFYSLKENSIKMMVLELLSVKWPLSINEIHKAICKANNLKVSYQAVHKAVKQLWSQDSLATENHKYQINLESLKELSEKLQQIEANYLGEVISSKTVFKKEGKIINLLIVKEGIVQDKLRDQRLNQLLTELIKIYRDEYPQHNIFQNKDNEIIFRVFSFILITSLFYS